MNRGLLLLRFAELLVPIVLIGMSFGAGSMLLVAMQRGHFLPKFYVLIPVPFVLIYAGIRMGMLIIADIDRLTPPVDDDAEREACQ